MGQLAAPQVFDPPLALARLTDLLGTLPEQRIA
jgi:hypothetical protein